MTWLVRATTTHSKKELNLHGTFVKFGSIKGRWECVDGATGKPSDGSSSPAEKNYSAIVAFEWWYAGWASWMLKR